MGKDLPTDWPFWRRIDEHFIGLSEKLVVARMEGWEASHGVTDEIEIAKALGKPVEYIDG
jgi:hypothetical protein